MVEFSSQWLGQKQHLKLLYSQMASYLKNSAAAFPKAATYKVLGQSTPVRDLFGSAGTDAAKAAVHASADQIAVEYPSQGGSTDEVCWKNKTLTVGFEIFTAFDPTANALPGVVNDAWTGTYSYFHSVYAKQ